MTGTMSPGRACYHLAGRRLGLATALQAGSSALEASRPKEAPKWATQLAWGGCVQIYPDVPGQFWHQKMPPQRAVWRSDSRCADTLDVARFTQTTRPYPAHFGAQKCHHNVRIGGLTAAVHIMQTRLRKNAKQHWYLRFSASQTSPGDKPDTMPFGAQKFHHNVRIGGQSGLLRTSSQ